MAAGPGEKYLPSPVSSLSLLGARIYRGGYESPLGGTEPRRSDEDGRGRKRKKEATKPPPTDEEFRDPVEHTANQR